MYTITPDGYTFLNTVRRLTDDGEFTVPEFEEQVLIGHRWFGETGEKKCDYWYSNGCRPAIWRFIDAYSTVDNIMYGYLCANCAERDMKNGCGLINPEPLYDAVYDPDIAMVYRAKRDRAIMAVRESSNAISNNPQ